MIGTIATVVGAVFGVLVYFQGIRNSKGHIRKQIRKKEDKIRSLESIKFSKYRNSSIFGIKPEDEKIEKLKQQIAKLKDRL